MNHPDIATDTTLPKPPAVKAVISSAEQVLDGFELLCGYAARGISNSALSQHMGIAPAAATKITNTLISFGWARKCPETGYFFPTARVVQLSAKAMRDLAAAEQKLADARASFTREI